MMPTFSDPERFLIKQWTDARLIEEGMKTVRNKYKELFEQVLEQVVRRHPELDYSKKYIVPAYGLVAIAKGVWPKGRWDWPSGFYLDYIQLEYLTSVEQTSPYAYIWINDDRLDWNQAEAKLLTTAKVVLSGEQIERIDHGVEDEGVWLGWQLNREDLTRPLVEDEAIGFIAFFVEQFEVMTKFISVV